jgi:predicted RND superfamily exporter protein
MANLAPSPEEAALVWSALADRVHERARRRAIDQALPALGDSFLQAPSARTAAAGALAQLLPGRAIGPAPRALETRVAGEPVLDRGFSRSVGKNQERSELVSIILVIFLMFLLFRSVYLAIVSVIPSGLAMASVFGAMGLLGVHIDISTSLVASIATGAGSDFAMHYLWYLKRSTPREVVRFVGPVMVISAVLVAAGFAVLGVGRSQPMRMFGGLAALAMGSAAAFTFLLVPALLRRVDRMGAPVEKEEP